MITDEELDWLTEEFGHITVGTTRCHMVENGVTFYFPLKVLEKLIAYRRLTAPAAIQKPEGGASK